MEMETGRAWLGAWPGLERFSRMVLEDGALHQALRQAPDVESFIALAVELGQKRGCRFTAEEVRAALQEKRREWLQHWI